MRNPFRKKRNVADNIAEKNTIPSQQEGWYPCYLADELLNNEYRQKLLSLIWQRVSMDKARFNRLYIAAIHNYVNIVQLLPASESHHHAYPGGMIDHGLEVINFALKLRQPYLLPIGGVAEDIPRQAEAWSAAVMYGALLHDIGKVVVDIHVELKNGEVWTPWSGPIHDAYRFKYKPSREYALHPSAGALMIQHIVPNEGMTWLSQFPELFSAFLHLSAGHYDKAGILGELVQKADMASVSHNLGGDPSKVGNKPVLSLADKIIGAIRYLIEHELKLNGQQACDGWFDGRDVWVLSKTMTDRVRAYLLQNGITEVPSDNSKIFDILKEHRIAITTDDDKTIWKCNIKSESGWKADSLTLIRIPVMIAFSTIDKAPDVFSGSVTPLASTDVKEATADENISTSLPQTNTIAQAPTAAVNTDLSSLSSQQENKAETTDLNSLVMGLFADTNWGVEQTDAVNSQDENDITGQQHDDAMTYTQESASVTLLATEAPTVTPTSTPSQWAEQEQELEGDDFLRWVRQEVIQRHLLVNTQKAYIHTVEQKIFLVSPGIFKKYSLYLYGNKDDENWKKLQYQFQALKLHTKRQCGTDTFNFWECNVSGKNKTKPIKGYLIDNKGLFAIPDNLPDNPHLSLVSDENEKQLTGDNDGKSNNLG